MANAPSRSSTGNDGLDHVLYGGLPTGRTTLLTGGPGCGKTVTALQTLVAAAERGEPAIFVAFEESSARIIENARSFGWDLEALQREQLFFLDAQPSPEVHHDGSFDLHGLLAGLGAKIDQMNAQHLAFDALDVVLSLLDDPRARYREVARLHTWLIERGLTALITAKVEDSRSPLHTTASLPSVQYLVDCAIELENRLEEDVAQRSLRVVKYRGSAFVEGAVPIVIGPSGLEVDVGPRSWHDVVTEERLTTGVPGLDDMLEGGYFRGASVLITGAPGTSKTTLCGAYAAAMAAADERTLFVSFDSLVLSDDGITLRDVYTGGGEVLFGTLRWEREQQAAAARAAADASRAEQLAELIASEARLKLEVEASERRLEAARAARRALVEDSDLRSLAEQDHRARLAQVRSGPHGSADAESS